jgi:hypothetical protein
VYHFQAIPGIQSRGLPSPPRDNFTISLNRDTICRELQAFHQPKHGDSFGNLMEFAVEINIHQCIS